MLTSAGVGILCTASTSPTARANWRTDTGAEDHRLGDASRADDLLALAKARPETPPDRKPEADDIVVTIFTPAPPAR